MNSMYKRQFMMMAGMILISFALLGVAFITLSYQYTVREKRSSMESIASNVSEYTSEVFTGTITASNQSFLRYVESMAKAADASIMICQRDGEIFYFSDGQGSYQVIDASVPASMTRSVLDTGVYEGISTLGGVFSEQRYVTGKAIRLNAVYIQPGQVTVQPETIGMVFVAAETSSVTEGLKIPVFSSRTALTPITSDADTLCICSQLWLTQRTTPCRSIMHSSSNNSSIKKGSRLWMEFSTTTSSTFLWGSTFLQERYTG